jgi:cell division protein FtsL
MSQQDQVKKATLKAYLTSGAVVVLSLLVFFFFHKQQDDEAREQITKLRAQLAESQKEIEPLKSTPSGATSEPVTKPESKPVVPPQMTLIEPTTP